MKRLSLLLVLLFSLAACTPAGTTNAIINAEPETAPIQENSSPPEEEAEAPPPITETKPPNCLGAETHPIGQSIADEYDFVTYQEVMTWFCNGAEFEDILTALQTEELTGTPTEELLTMLADGFTWEEIWLLEGLIE